VDERRIVEINGMTIEFRGDEVLGAAALRAFVGVTPLDAEVDALPLPVGPYWLRFCIQMLRWYRSRISLRLGQRCVFEPSCSRYAELAFRRRGFFIGNLLTLRRLCRCRPGAGGVDVP